MSILKRLRREHWITIAVCIGLGLWLWYGLVHFGRPYVYNYLMNSNVGSIFTATLPVAALTLVLHYKRKAHAEQIAADASAQRAKHHLALMKATLLHREESSEPGPVEDPPTDTKV